VGGKSLAGTCSAAVGREKVGDLVMHVTMKHTNVVVVSHRI